MAEWDCTGCGRHIIAVGVQAPPFHGLCAMCSTMGPVRGRAFQDWQDGVISEQQFRAMFEQPPAFICPRCGAASWHKGDGLNGWCGWCQDFTAPPA